MKTKILIILSMTVALGVRAQAPDLGQLENTVKAMQQMITNLQQEILELKKQQAKSPPSATQPAAAPAGGVEFVAPTIKTPPAASQIIPHESLRDYQEAAQRPGSLTLDPKYRGFIPIPNTPAFIKFNAKVRLDMMDDNRNSGNPDRFVTAQIPVEGEATHGGGGQRLSGSCPQFMREYRHAVSRTSPDGRCFMCRCT